jgi:hypothetical protein
MATELKLDIDTDRTEISWLGMSRRIDLVESLLGLKEINCKIRNTKHGYHWYIKIKETLTPIETCLIQTLMGSDYKRECFNLIRIKHHCKRWNVLFQKKYQYSLSEKILKLVSEEK